MQLRSTIGRYSHGSAANTNALRRVTASTARASSVNVAVIDDAADRGDRAATRQHQRRTRAHDVVAMQVAFGGHVEDQVLHQFGLAEQPQRDIAAGHRAQPPRRFARLTDQRDPRFAVLGEAGDQLLSRDHAVERRDRRSPPHRLVGDVVVAPQPVRHAAGQQRQQQQCGDAARAHAKKSLPLSSTTRNAGKSCTVIFHTDSMPRSA